MSRFITGSFKKIELDHIRYTSALDQAIRDVTRSAWYAFFEAAQDKVPVETGEARGLFKPLADWVDAQLDLSGAAPTAERNADEGAFHSMLDVSGFTWPKYVVVFKAETFNGWWWEKFRTLYNARIGRPVTAGPWEAFEAGKAAYILYLRTNLKFAIPDIAHYLTLTPIEPK